MKRKKEIWQGSVWSNFGWKGNFFIVWYCPWTKVKELKRLGHGPGGFVLGPHGGPALQREDNHLQYYPQVRTWQQTNHALWSGMLINNKYLNSEIHIKYEFEIFQSIMSEIHLINISIANTNLIITYQNVYYYIHVFK